ncbi:MAG TPA: phage portal protein [Candidatus Limnocylindrales bacterium]
MALSPAEAQDQVQELYKRHTAERAELDVLRLYATSKQRLPAVIPSDASNEIKEMARTARINVISIVIDSLTQALFVDGFRARDEESGDDVTVPVWEAWQANRMDKRQSGLVRATVGYGTGYMVLGQSDPERGPDLPVMRPVSPRLLTAVYGDDDDWPRFALEKRPRTDTWRLYDDELVWPFAYRDSRWELTGDPSPHGLAYPPVVRFRDAEDLDLDDEAEPDNLVGLGLGRTTRVVAGQIAPLMSLQDQINLTSFSLKVAEWYSAFRKIVLIGWTPATKTEKVEASAATVWAFDEHPDEMRVDQLAQTELSGYIQSREAALKYAATLSQTPVHELTGQLIQMSADALAAAEAGKDRKVDERQTGMGESWEQTFQAVGELMNVEVPNDAQVIWRDTSARSFAATVDALGKLVQMLGIPPAELLDRVPGLTQQDVRRIKAAMESGDALANLTNMMDRQAQPPAPEPDPAPAE